MSTSIPPKSKPNDLLKVIAIITMVIDHIGYAFFPEQEVFRIIGRIAFPIFTYQIAVGYRFTSNPTKYMKRIVWFALLSQIPYTLLFHGALEFNVLFDLLLGLLSIQAIQKHRLWQLLFYFGFAYFLPIDYGVYGISMTILFYLFYSSNTHTLLVQVLLISLQTWVFQHWNLQIFAIIGVLCCLYLPKDRYKVYLNKYFFYWFYPVHLMILFLISLLLYN